jgi:hypothetical protein
MFKEAKENMFIMNEKIGNLWRHMETIKRELNRSSAKQSHGQTTDTIWYTVLLSSELRYIECMKFTFNFQ